MKQSEIADLKKVILDQGKDAETVFRETLRAGINTTRTNVRRNMREVWGHATRQIDDLERVLTFAHEIGGLTRLRQMAEALENCQRIADAPPPSPPQGETP